MNARLAPIAAALAIMISFSGLPSVSPAAEDSDNLIIYEDVRLPPGSTPADITLATRALLLRIRGIRDRNAETTVRFSRPVAAKLAAQAPRYPGFALKQIRIRQLAPSERRDIARGRRLIGEFVLRDQSGRNARQGFAIDYRFDGSHVDVHDAAVLTLPPTRPEVQSYVVPAEKMPLNWAEKGLSHLALLERIETAAVDPADPPGGMRNWMMYVFVMDQLPDDDKLLAYMPGKKNSTFRVASFLGWRVIEKSFSGDLGLSGIPTLELWLDPGLSHPPAARQRRVIAIVSP